MKSGVSVSVSIAVHFRCTDRTEQGIHLSSKYKVTPSAYHYDDPIKLQFEVEYLAKLQAINEIRKHFADANKETVTYTGVLKQTIVVVEYDIIETEE